MASSMALTDSPGVSRGTPSLTIESHMPPAPMPSTTRPPERADSEVMAWASTGAGRLGRLVTVTAPWMRDVAPSRKARPE